MDNRPQLRVWHWYENSRLPRVQSRSILILGMLSRALSPHVRSIVGVDISASCVSEYNLRVMNQGLDPEDMRAVVSPPTGAPVELKGAQFDVVVVSYWIHLL